MYATTDTKIGDIEFREGVASPGNSVVLCDTEIGRFTVLDRETGYSGYCGPLRDIETGFRDLRGEFWLRCGRFDIRTYPDLTVAEAAELLKSDATFHDTSGVNNVRND